MPLNKRLRKLACTRFKIAQLNCLFINYYNRTTSSLLTVIFAKSYFFNIDSMIQEDKY